MSRSAFAPRLSTGRAMRSLLEDAQDDHAQAPEAPVRRALEVGAADDRAEREADAVAEQVLARIGGSSGDVHRSHTDATPAGAIGAAGGALDDAASGAIESARGGGSALDAGVRREMESGFGRSLGDVRIHTDARADQLSRQMSARAFTTGRDIFFARGEYDPTSAPGRHTLAHELAHTVQDGGGVHRKLRGTAEALETQGGGATSGKLRKLVRSRTNWDKIVATVREYEAEESALLAGGKNPDPMTLMSAKPGMLKLLDRALAYVKEWRKANTDAEPTGKGKKQKDDEEDDAADTRSKSARRQAIGMLEPRIGTEVRLLSANDSAGWLASMGLSPNQVVATRGSDSGQMNKVDKLDYQSEGGSFSGFFKQDKGFSPERHRQEQQVGIQQLDPNYGARTVALYRLDQLFDAQVTARAEFAVHKNDDGKSVLGTVMESARGTQGGKVAYKHSGDRGPGVSISDPKLQSGLNKLQLLDAIAGQLDRHMDNLFIDTDDTGNVTSITGIDNDMAFGRKMNKTSNQRIAAHNYRGLPEYIDKTMGEKILQVRDADIRDALTGLLPGPEIEATVRRFIEVQNAVKVAKATGKLEDNWGEESSKRGLSKISDLDFSSKRTAYHENAKSSWTGTKRMIDFAKRELRLTFRTHRSWSDLPMEMIDHLEIALQLSYEGNPAVVSARQYALERHLNESDTRELIRTIIDYVLDRLDSDKYAVMLQEAFDQEDEKKLDDAMYADYQKIISALGNDGLTKLCEQAVGGR